MAYNAKGTLCLAAAPVAAARTLPHFREQRSKESCLSQNGDNIQVGVCATHFGPKEESYNHTYKAPVGKVCNWQINQNDYTTNMYKCR